MKLQVGETVATILRQTWEGVTFGQWYAAEQCMATSLLLKDFGCT
jgi:hypothetical protein